MTARPVAAALVAGAISVGTISVAAADDLLEAAIDIHPDAASLGPSSRTALAGRQAGPSRTGPESAAR